jgi:hypothetical protein
MLTHTKYRCIAALSAAMLFAAGPSAALAGVQTFTFVDISDKDLHDDSLDVNIDLDSALSHPGHSTPALISATLGAAGLPDVGLPSAASFGRSANMGSSRELRSFAPNAAASAAGVPGNEYFESPLVSKEQLAAPMSTDASGWSGAGSSGIAGRGLAGNGLAGPYGSPNGGASSGGQPPRGLPVGNDLPRGNEVAGGGQGAGSVPRTTPVVGPPANPGGLAGLPVPTGPDPVGPAPTGQHGNSASPNSPWSPESGPTHGGFTISLPPITPPVLDIVDISQPGGAPILASNYSANPSGVGGDDCDLPPAVLLPPVGQDMPEPGTLLIWGGLAAAVAYRFRNRLSA